MRWRARAGCVILMSLHPRLLAVIVLTLGVLACFAACSKDVPYTFLQPEDYEAPEGGAPPFDPNNLVDTPSFIDTNAMVDDQVQVFLNKTPYDRPSFLATYQSNGVRASDAVLKVARAYRINPIILLARLQMAQGLVGQRDYPFPTDRVEYVFRCGCNAGTTKACDPAFAGIDKQLDCFARALRDSLNAIKASGETSGGWAPDKTVVTLDGKKVTPANEATAALYQYLPVVGGGKAGNALFWNIWQLYTFHAGYAGAVGGGGDGNWVGDGCAADGDCGYPDPLCITGYPNGSCSAPCTAGCPKRDGKPPAFCAKFRDGGFCMVVCNPGAPACRPGYVCKRSLGLAQGASEFVCIPGGA